MRIPGLPVLLFLGLRVWLLGTNFEATCVPNYELAPMGLMAWAWAEGVPGLGAAELYDNCGGHLLVGWVGAGLFGFFGSHYWVLKLVPLGFGVVTLVLIWWSLRRHAGERTASLFAWLYALGTPALLQASVIAMGNHYEGLLAQACVYASYLEWRSRPSAPRAFAFGLVASLGTTLYFGASVMVLCCGACAAWSLRGTARRWLPSALGGAAFGAVPLLWIERATGGRPSGFLAHVLEGSWRLDWQAVGQRAWRFSGEVLGSAASSPGLGPVPGRAFDLLFCALAGTAALSALLLLRRRADATGLLPLLFFLPAVVLVFGVSKLGFPRFATPLELLGRRYTYGMQLVSIVLIAWCSSRWIERGRVPLASLSLVGTALVLVSGLGLMRPGAWTLEPLRRYPGHHAPYLVGPLLRGALDQPHRVRERLQGLPAEVREGALFGVGHHLGLMHLSGVDAPGLVPALSRMLSPWEAAERPAIARGLGASLRAWVPLEGPVPERFRGAIARLGGHPGPLRAFLIEGMAEDFEYPLVRNLAAFLKRTHHIAYQLPADQVGSLWKGHGRRCRQMMDRGLPEDYALLKLERERIPTQHVPAFLRGLTGKEQP